MFTNHYGRTVDSETPIVGVINNSAISQLIGESYDAINLDALAHQAECPDFIENGECDCLDFAEQGTLLIGNWKQDENGKYELDPNGKDDYSLIVGEIYTQVVWSRTMKRCALCSPCYPGQGDLDSEGDYLTYSIEPDEL